MAESATLAFADLDRLECDDREGERGQRRVRGSWLPNAIEALLRALALTPKALAGRLKIAAQTGTALMCELQERGIVREASGQGSF